MLEKIKSKISNKNKLKFKYNFTKKNAAIVTTIMLALVTCIGISSYEPGNILFNHQSESNKKILLPEVSKSTGPKQPVEMEEKNSYGQKMTNKKLIPSLEPNPSLPAPAFSSDDFFNKLPTTMPSFTTTPSLPNGFTGNNNDNSSASPFDANMVYAHHVSITDNIKNILNSAFSLVSLSDAPKDNHERKFVTSYAINNDGNISEKFELMSIVRTNSMSNIKTASDALNTLVEEHDSVNIIESTDSYLIYNLAGNKGYQIGKISIDDQGIYILGYVNLTTNDMPSILVDQWVETLKTL